VHFIPLHQHPYYREKYGFRPGDLPVASTASRRILTLPLYPKMTDDDVQDVIDAVRSVLKENER
jgi:dTDP-4-amino-4,6-dideoxygalactose transaminase